MKTVILAGGLGTRISEESHLKPKPMVEIGGFPVLWHIMRVYASQGFNDFVVCLGYKGYVIKEYFANYFLHSAKSVTFDLQRNQMFINDPHEQQWRVTLVETGLSTMTGGRIKRIQSIVGNEPFCLTYGDGLADINLKELVSFHQKMKRKATVTVVQPAGRFGAACVDDDRVCSFQEKPVGDGGWISGGFFVLEPDIFEMIEGDLTVWEQEPLERLAQIGELSAFKHTGFWQPMDTLRDSKLLQDLWHSGKAPWKVWHDRD
ncbi:MAG: glucose-1-phosphate cytidylyltransferase [Pseudomonadota bacterium]|jgi:glucose-1-phosphate cytidylyltransferase